MALFGPWDTVRAQAAGLNWHAEVFAYLGEVLAPGSTAQARLQAQPVGETLRIELGGGAFALEQTYVTKERSEGFFESHRRYIDVQVIFAGEELMEVADIGRLQVKEPWDDKKDFIVYQDCAGASVLRLRAGDAAVFHPEDGHMPSLRAGREPAVVRKTVVKVPVQTV